MTEANADLPEPAYGRDSQADPRLTPDQIVACLNETISHFQNALRSLSQASPPRQSNTSPTGDSAVPDQYVSYLDQLAEEARDVFTRLVGLKADVEVLVDPKGDDRDLGG